MSARPVKRAIGMLVALVMAAECATSTTERLRLPPLQAVAHVDLSRYLGTWYEIAKV
jgi:apolipoprotein D and lipocalin family protein